MRTTTKKILRSSALAGLPAIAIGGALSHDARFGADVIGSGISRVDDGGSGRGSPKGSGGSDVLVAGDSAADARADVATAARPTTIARPSR